MLWAAFCALCASRVLRPVGHYDTISGIPPNEPLTMRPEPDQQIILIWNRVESNASVNAQLMTLVDGAIGYNATKPADRGIRIVGVSAFELILDQSISVLHIWTLPADLCTSTVLVYTSPSELMATRVYNSYPEMCIFFSHMPPYNSFTIQGQATVDEYEGRDIQPHPPVKLSNQPRFFRISKMSEPLNFTLSITQLQGDETPCEKSFIGQVNRTEYKMWMYESAGLMTCEAVVPQDQGWNFIIVGVVALFVMIVLLFIAIFTDWYKELLRKIRMRITGERDANMDIDLSRVLREDEQEEAIDPIEIEIEEEEEVVDLSSAEPVP